jgi:hypothetical protein
LADLADATTLTGELSEADPRCGVLNRKVLLGDSAHAMLPHHGQGQPSQPEHLPEDQVQQPQRHVVIMSRPAITAGQRLMPDFWHPTPYTHSSLRTAIQSTRTAPLTARRRTAIARS